MPISPPPKPMQRNTICSPPRGRGVVPNARGGAQRGSPRRGSPPSISLSNSAEQRQIPPQYRQSMSALTYSQPLPQTPGGALSPPKKPAKPSIPDKPSNLFENSPKPGLPPKPSIPDKPSNASPIQSLENSNEDNSPLSPSRANKPQIPSKPPLPQKPNQENLPVLPRSKMLSTAASEKTLPISRSNVQRASVRIEKDMKFVLPGQQPLSPNSGRRETQPNPVIESEEPPTLRTGPGDLRRNTKRVASMKLFRKKTATVIHFNYFLVILHLFIIIFYHQGY